MTDLLGKKEEETGDSSTKHSSSIVSRSHLASFSNLTNIIVSKWQILSFLNDIYYVDVCILGGYLLWLSQKYYITTSMQFRQTHPINKHCKRRSNTKCDGVNRSQWLEKIYDRSNAPVKSAHFLWQFLHNHRFTLHIILGIFTYYSVLLAVGPNLRPLTSLC